MLETKINFEIDKPSIHKFSLFYSKWVGKVQITIDGVMVRNTSITFGGDMREYVFGDWIVQIFPGQIFWVKPVVKIYLKNELLKVFKGNTEVQIDSIKNFSDQYELKNPFVAIFGVSSVLFLVAAGFFALFGVAIIPITVIYNPEQMRTSIPEMILVIAMLFGASALLLFLFFLFRKAKKMSEEMRHIN